MASQEISATYASQTDTRKFNAALPSLSTPAQQFEVKEKTEYLSALRQNVQLLQGEINVFLTQKMEEDNMAAESGKGLSKSRKEEREEEMYGEEEQESDG